MTGRTRVLAATTLGSNLALIDGSVVNVALPAIQGSLAVGAAVMAVAPNGRAGVASAVNNVSTRVGPSLAAAVLGSSPGDAGGFFAGFRHAATARAVCASAACDAVAATTAARPSVPRATT